MRKKVLPVLFRVSRARWRALAAALSAMVLLVAAPTAFAGETRIGINGARPSELPGFAQILGGAGFTSSGWLNYADRVGANWLPGMTPVPLDYPAQLGPLWGIGALSGDKSLALGQQALHAAILAELANGNNVSVVGLSMGTMVIDRELEYLHTLPESEALPTDRITFYVFGGETRGFGETYAPNVRIPLLGITFRPVPETRYNTVVVYGQWDGWAAPPDRPWNMLAVVNAVMGALYTVNGTNDHSSAGKKSIEDAVLVSDHTNSLGGRTLTYMIPEASLPITRPLRQLGVPGWIVDKLNTLLMPLIAAGYSSMTPELGWHVSKGRLVWKTPVTTPTPAPVPAAADHDADAAPDEIGGGAAEITGAALASDPGPDSDPQPAEEGAVGDTQESGPADDLDETTESDAAELIEADEDEPSREEQLAELGLSEPADVDPADEREAERAENTGNPGTESSAGEADSADADTDADTAADTPAAA